MVGRREGLEGDYVWEESSWSTEGVRPIKYLSATIFFQILAAMRSPSFYYVPSLVRFFVLFANTLFCNFLLISIDMILGLLQNSPATTPPRPHLQVHTDMRTNRLRSCVQFFTIFVWFFKFLYSPYFRSWVQSTCFTQIRLFPWCNVSCFNHNLNENLQGRPTLYVVVAVVQLNPI